MGRVSESSIEKHFPNALAVIRFEQKKDMVMVFDPSFHADGYVTGIRVYLFYDDEKKKNLNKEVVEDIFKMNLKLQKSSSAMDGTLSIQPLPTTVSITQKCKNGKWGKVRAKYPIDGKKMNVVDVSVSGALTIKGLSMDFTIRGKYKAGPTAPEQTGKFSMRAPSAFSKALYDFFK